MTEDIWVVAMINTATDASYSGEMYSMDWKKAGLLAHKNALGEVLPASAFSKKAYADSTRPRKLRHFAASGMTVYMVSPQVAEVLRAFDLGQGSLYPIRFFAKDRKTPLDLHHLYLNFGNAKDSVLLEQSPGARGHGPTDDRWYYSLSLSFEDGSIALSPAALDGPDIWIEKQLSRAYFISGRLMAALKKQKLDRGLRKARCRIVK